MGYAVQKSGAQMPASRPRLKLKLTHHTTRPRTDDSPLLHRRRSRHDELGARLRPPDRRRRARGPRRVAMGKPGRSRRGADPPLVPLFAGGRARRGIGDRRMDRRPTRPPTGRRNARARRTVGQVVALSPFGRPLRADPALGIGGSSAGAKDLARPRRRVDPERPAGRLGPPFRG